MKVMAVNAGSSSLKYQLLSMPDETVISSGLVERIGNDNGMFTMKVGDQKFVYELPIKDHKVGVDLVLKAMLERGVVKSLNDIKSVGHRVVQGGELFKDSVVIDDEVINKIASLIDLGPLHNPAHIVGMKAFKEVLPNVLQCAVFDTTFHQTMEDVAYMYATPYEWYKKYGVRKYGAHGTSHLYVSKRAIQLLGKKKSKIIVCHIGNGASLCAVKNGISVDTSMGLTPLDGIPMGTRTGAVDPTVVEFIHKKEGKSVEEITSILNKKSGYLGVSEVSHDSRDVESAAKSGNAKAKLALDLQAKRIADYIGSYYVFMEGLDAICFTAGIGENSSYVRELVCNRLGVLGVKLDNDLNNTRGKEALISTSASKVKVYIIPTNEEVMIARDVVRLSKSK